MEKETNYHKFRFLNEIPSCCLSHRVLKRTTEQSNKSLLSLKAYGLLGACI